MRRRNAKGIHATSGFHYRWRVWEAWIPLDDMQRVQGSIYAPRYSSGETADSASAVTRREDTNMQRAVLRAPRDVDVVEADDASVRERPPSASWSAGATLPLKSTRSA
jgi:hypothetical protein